MSNNNYRILSEEIPCLEIKNMPNVKISGIYKIENIINHKIYIGQSNNIISRLKRGHLRMTSECNIHLKNAFQKYGYENFTVTVIKETYDLDYWEIFLIQIYHAMDRERGYNICSGGEGGSPFLGRHHSDEAKRKKSEAMKKFYSTKVWTDEERDRCRYWKGKKHTEEWIKRNSESHKGLNRYVKTEEHRRKIAETLKGNIPWNKGKKMNEEYCEKQREAKRALYSSEKSNITKQKLRDANLGMYYWNNGVTEFRSKEPVVGFSRGKLSESGQNRKYWYTNGEYDILTSKCPSDCIYGRTFPNVKGQRWNNGKINVFAVNCPGEGFVRGQLR